MMRRAVVQTASPVATCRRFGLHPDIYRRGSFHSSIFMASVKYIIPVLLSLSMEWIWIIIGVILAIVAIAGSILPLIPGPPVAYVGLLLQQLRDDKPFTINFLLLWAAIVVVSLILDYVIPIWGTKKFGGTKYGVWGCTLGFIAVFWLGPWGIIIGPFLGAFAGEMLAQQNSNIAFKAALGSFVGFLAGSFLKLVICFFMLYYILTSI